jgi:hypothetical protein
MSFSTWAGLLKRENTVLGLSKFTLCPYVRREVSKAGLRGKRSRWSESVPLFGFPSSLIPTSFSLWRLILYT